MHLSEADTRAKLIDPVLHNRGGTEELENPYIFNAPDVVKAGGLNALKSLGEPKDIINEAKKRLFAV
ncbi:MAG: hypothetical protein A3I04_07900 [Nitrospinae bacterium RIFCSPLOWO2_02_FULL_39_110]|nr:MAG: hypothetical protein A3D97_08700 [Nitrospinae bacterium RIFCSPHIGHO2_12_FULL_39_42]OGW01192.1 MAG: hypothetical protein A3D20_06305 [Nitrospinae bacterium RIFCSPHIGHO2_02_FULL_39_82]OGW02012.1 MAG: hypothetical protein A2Z59_03075 [Nitrospinae bacterium RIFCSPLOWO2_02_39_17]OGW05266.1 MAG: hypothetical protein A3I04_07900 [Nitrospinae bacterium RIFCSPLOWO2_02_FULL_39_110]OGW11880.1 MAG: hypothetical protein A2W75_07800 [Nitrospinae bacterium RIFCSPLOWO2_12_39_15]HLA48890.1 hypothetical